MKKMMMIALAALLLALGVMAALAVTADKNMQNEAAAADAAVQEYTAPAEEIYELSGSVIEVADGYFIMLSGVMGEVQVNVSEDSLFEGVEFETLAAGQVVQVLYDGKMTRSLPPQVFALKVGMYPVSGEVTAVEQESITVLRDEIGDEVIVFLPEGAPEIAVGDRVTAYTNGAMTMSLPAQTTAIGVVLE